MEEQLPSDASEWVGFSLKSIVLILAGIALLVWYGRVILFGENSLKTLNELRREKATLIRQSTELKKANQQLQKDYFELMQLSE